MKSIKPSKRINIPKFQGVYSRESSKRRHLGKPDKCFDICYRDSKGKLIWEKVGWVSEGYSAVTASKVRSERMRAIRHGEDLFPQKIDEVKLKDIWLKYDEWLNTGKIDPNTDRGYYKNHIEPLFADTILSKIEPFELERLKSKLINQGLAPATVKHVLVLIRQIINKAKLWGMWSGENPVKKVKLPKLNNRRERFLSFEEAHILLRELDKVSIQVKNMALLSLHTGMRAGEIFALKWGHVDMENKLIHIADPKSGRARKAFISESIKEMFGTLCFGNPDDLVFPSQTNNQISAISHAFDRTIKRLSNSYEFWDEEFKEPMSIEKLRMAIEKDYPGLPFSNEINSLTWLNNLIKLPSFYKRVRDTHRKYKFSEEVKKSVLIISKYPLNDPKSYSVLEEGNIQKLNRLLLETIYEGITPKIKPRFNNGVTDPRQKITFHTLRHTFASWLALQGTPILTIKELLGHQSLAMTERYSHLSPDQKKQAVEGIELMFTSNKQRNE